MTCLKTRLGVLRWACETLVAGAKSIFCPAQVSGMTSLQCMFHLLFSHLIRH